MSINLLYHDVAAIGNDDVSGFPGHEAARYKLPPDEFKHHLEQIAAAVSCPPIATIGLDDQLLSQPHSWMISFDDGGLSAYTDIASLLEQRGWRGWFFIATDFIDKPSFCTREQIKELSRRGHIIGSHSCSHPERFSSCPWNKLVDEWTRSCQILSELIGQPITSASVPGGFYSHDVARTAAQAGIKILFNSEPTTAWSRIEGMVVLGRFNVYRGMPATDAQALLTSPVRRWRQAAFWNLKKVAKVMVGPVYKMVRRQLLSRSYSKGTP
jgi:peptidoglycan/xylan/chitin deacetylase (PgdA/CDA1 family)